MTLAPFTAVMLASYGGPDKPADVLPFMRNATRGKGIPDARLEEVSEHYMLFGGKSPINELNIALASRISDELARRGIDVPVVRGNRNWHPYFKDATEQLLADGHTRVLALDTSAYRSYSSCRQYWEDLEGASADVDGAVQFEKLGPFAETDAFIAANARKSAESWRALRSRWDGDAKLVFVTHSIPLSMNEHSGVTPEEHYDKQHLRVAARIATEVRRMVGEELEWELTYCSRSGPPQMPWLEPDVSDRLPELKAQGVGGVVVAPIGFISDHMEVIYDLDTQAKEAANECSLEFERAGTVDDDPEFVAMLVDKLEEAAAAARGEREIQNPCHFQSNKQCCRAR